MTFLDLFSGIGGFRRGLERSGHTCVGHVEIDKYANKSYMAMYGLLYCPYDTGSGSEANCCRMCSQEVRDDCNGETCKGEWYAKDIKQLTAGEIPKAEIWTFGFPCTDISISGRMAGLHGARSGLFFTVSGLLKSTAPEDKPQYLIVENVKHLLSGKRGGDFTSVLFELWEAGYDCEWCVVNSRDFDVPQNRERVYLVGYSGGGRGRKVFPVSGANPAPVKRIVDGRQGMRIYDSSDISIALSAASGGFAGKTGLYAVSAHILPCASFIDLSRDPKFTENSRSVMAKQYAGITNHKGETSGVFICKGHSDCERAVVTPERTKKRQNGRGIREPGEPAFTLTCQDCHDILVCCRVRRLTPRECWRLQAFEDFLFDRAKAAGISDAQLYKQAGNAVTVNVVYEIGRKLKEMEAGDGMSQTF